MVEQWNQICWATARWINFGNSSAHGMMVTYEVLLKQLEKVVRS